MEALAGYGTFEQDVYARVLDLTMWVGRKVPERTGDKQHPIIKISNLEDNFALAWYAGGEKSVRPLPKWETNIPSITPGLDIEQVASFTPGLDIEQVASLRRRLANHRKNLLLVEERMTEFVEFTDIPLGLLNNKRRIEEEITKLEQKLGGTNY